MKRTKRLTLRRLVLGLAVVAIAAPVAQAKPTPADRPDHLVIDEQGSIRLGPGEIPYLDRTTVTLGPGEIPYVVDGTVASPPTQDAPAAATDGGYDIGYGIVSSMVIILLLAVAGSVFAIRHSRRARLSPA
jgi:hypothetical protein